VKKKSIQSQQSGQPRANYTEVTEKLQKVLARAGLGSRREMETWIQAGRVLVNRKPATLGQRVGPSDDLSVDRRKVRTHAQPRYPLVLCYHKPTGLICSRNDPEGRPTVFDKLPRPKQGRWISVGRLDINTSGLLLLTTDGDLANALMHPSNQIEREYAVRILGKVDRDMLKRLREGVQLEDGMAHFDQISDGGGQGANHWFNVTLMEGKKREVRRLWESQGVQVSRLIRIRFGGVILQPRLRTGKTAELPLKEVKLLMKAAAGIK